MTTRLLCRLSGQGEQLVELLTGKVQVLLPEQIAEHLGIDLGSARRLVRKLLREGWLRVVEGPARWPPPPLKRKLWSPGTPLPEAGSIAYSSKSRFLQCGVRYVRSYAATKRAARYFGTPVARLKTHQLGHDLTLSSVAGIYRHRFPTAFLRWRGEQVMSHTRSGFGELLPDAFLVWGDAVLGVIEVCVGHYNAARIRRVFEDARARELDLDFYY